MKFFKRRLTSDHSVISQFNNIKGFKSAGKNNEYLVTLLIDLDAPNNLARQVFDRNHAKYRCKTAKVLSIVQKDTDEPVDKAQSQYDPDFIYTVGETLIVPDYQSDIDQVCTKGIHFYLTEETARSHEYIQRDGPHMDWYDDGQKRHKVNCLNGQLHGSYQTWYSNGQIAEQSTYQDGRLQGLYQTWCKDGQIKEVSNYQNGERQNGELYGRYQSWYLNGQIHQNGQLHGPYQISHENGRKREKSFSFLPAKMKL